MEKVKLQNAYEALKSKNEVEVLTQGKSMEPLFKEHRDIAVISRVEKPFKKGDVVLYSRDNKSFILHRIVKIKDNSLIIKGDNNLNFERDIKKEDIIGILTALYRKGRYMTAKDIRFKAFAVFSKIRYPFIYVYRKLRHFLWKKLKAER